MTYIYALFFLTIGALEPGDGPLPARIDETQCDNLNVPLLAPPERAILALDLRGLAEDLDRYRSGDHPSFGLKALLADDLPTRSETPDPWGLDDDRNRAESTREFLRLAEVAWGRARGILRDGAEGKASTSNQFVLDQTPSSLLVDAEPASLRTELAKTLLMEYPHVAQVLNLTTPQPREVLGILLLTVQPNFFVGGKLTIPSPALETARRVALPSNDPLVYGQWALERTQVFEAWEEGHRGNLETRVAVIDSGFDSNQRDLPKVSETKWFCDSKMQGCEIKDGADGTGHGTAVAGIIGAQTNNEYRIAGVNWDVELLNLRVLGNDGTGTVFDGARALDAAREYGSAVASLAWGGPCASQELWNAILRAQGGDVLVVAAAGNEQSNLDEDPSFFPAAFRHKDYECDVEGECLHNLLVVGATKLVQDAQGKLLDKRASFSNFGPKIVQMGAPGVGVTTTWLQERKGIIDATGTSAATALVAGAAAVVAGVVQTSPGGVARFEQIRNRLLKGADSIPKLIGGFEAGRRLNVCRAVSDGGLSNCAAPL